MEKQRAPLALSTMNKGIPKFSRLPQPGTLSRKRPLSKSVSEGKENGSAIKRAKTTTATIKATIKPASKVTARPKITTVRGTKAPLKPMTRSSSTTSANATRSKISSTTANGRPASTTAAGKTAKRPVRQETSVEQKVSVSAQLESLSNRLTELEKVKKIQESTILVREQEKTVAHSQIKELEENILAKQAELEALRESKMAAEAKAVDLSYNLASSQAEVTSLKSALSQTMASMSAVQAELEATKISRDTAISDGVTKAGTITTLHEHIASLERIVEECRSQIRSDESTRRQLHNTILELKGNIRVFCRVRPLLPTDPDYLVDDTGRESSVSGSSRGSKNGRQPVLGIMYPDSKNDQKKLSVEYSSQDKAKKNYDFSFDKVFGPDSTQQLVFSEISQLVQSALDGYNVCIFAYGQTGSGKTFTMEGPEERVLLESEGDAKGMIPRAVEQVFKSSMELREKGWEYKMEAMFLEIYNETLRDLLSSNSVSQTLEIKKDPNHSGEVYVTNVTPTVVTSQVQVQKLLERASKNRAVAATQCNERSSRSHSVFIFTIIGRNEKTGEKCRGVLNLVDLAGSERLSQSGSSGERLRETKNINKSLTNLGTVILALANKESHIPYRNSKLTYLLQNSLGGNSKTLMFVNVSPQTESFQETLCSLRFATTVNHCNIGTAKKSIK